MNRLYVYLIFYLFLSLKLWALSMPAPPGFEPGACPMNYSPVCGADGRTYSNSCQARNSGQQSFQSGSCSQTQPTGPDCVHCGGNPFIGTRPNPYFPMFRPAPRMPWWAQQGHQRYPNFYYPGAWQRYGMNPRPYPGGSQGGAAFAAKPNVYIQGPENAELQVELSFPKKSQHLVSTPNMTQALDVQIKKNGGLKVNEAIYDYLFYDFRFDHTQSQYLMGECMDGEKLIPKMIQIIEELGHSDKSKEDFRVHWSQKIPYANRYCIYPQFNKELSKVAKLNLVSKEYSISLNRVHFVVQLVPDKETLSFPPSPQKPIEPPVSKKRRGSEIQVREWGVAFLADDVLEFSSP